MNWSSRRVWLSVCLSAVLASYALAGKPQEKEADADKGKEVFDQCGVCHNADSNEKKMGPGLKGLFQKEKLTNGKKPTEENVRALIDAGGKGMPAYKEILTDEEKDNLIAYLKTL